MIFSYRNYKKICDVISGCSGDVVIKHDVELLSKSSLDLAKIEHDFGIRSIFFYQFDVFIKDVEMVKEISRLGHEIGYHYDVLDNNKGDFSAAALEFEENLRVFSDNGFDIKWICPHGNPIIERNGWNSNKDFFRDSSIREKYNDLKDIVVEKEIFYPDFVYVSDAGYSFKEVSSVSNNDKVYSEDFKIKDFPSYLRKKGCSSYIISTHPHRWVESDSLFMTKFLLFMFLKWTYKITHRLPGLSRVYSQFFRFSRKF